jgi:hypothetical protein
MWEVGWNPIVVDEATWEPTTHQGISIWGHKPVGHTIIDKLEMFRPAHNHCSSENGRARTQRAWHPRRLTPAGSHPARV